MNPLQVEKEEKDIDENDDDDDDDDDEEGGVKLEENTEKGEKEELEPFPAFGKSNRLEHFLEYLFSSIAARAIVFSTTANQERC